MTLWFVFALMTALAVFAVLWPLGRATRPQREGNEAKVYKDQLAEIERDVSGGLIGASEAEAARVEISRRLLAAADAERVAPSSVNTTLRRAVAVIAFVGLPLIAVAFYLPLGSPKLPDFPLSQRAQAPSASQPLDNLVAQVEAHLEKNPTDGRGWNVLAPVLAKLGRFDEAVRAYRNSITYNGDSSSRRADLGEAIAAAAGGVVTSEAKAEFERAIALNADEVKASYFLGLAAEQDGRRDEAASIWRAMLAKAPSTAPWRPLVLAALARVGSGGPTAPALSDRLASRLKQNGDDVEGWLRLVRAYMVMGDRDKAKGASADARQAVAGDAERLRALNEGLKNLGVDG
jgi:cytochrome c-type biogenesis protein CcmH